MARPDHGFHPEVARLRRADAIGTSCLDARTMAERLTVEVAIVGGGPAALVAAIALAAAGVETALLARRPTADHRTTALLAGSVTALQTLGVWDGCAAQAAPLRVMRIVDATSRLIRAP